MVCGGKVDRSWPRFRAGARRCALWALLQWAAVGLLLLQPCPGHTAGAAYGERFVRLGQVWADGRPGGERRGTGGEERVMAGMAPAELVDYG